MARPVFRPRWRSASTRRSVVARKHGYGCKWPTTWRRPASTKPRLRLSGFCGGKWTSRIREIKREGKRAAVCAEGASLGWSFDRGSKTRAKAREADGFHRTARRAITCLVGSLWWLWDNGYGWGGLYDLEDDWGARWYP